MPVTFKIAETEARVMAGISRGLKPAGDLVKAEMVRLVKATPKTGRWYSQPKPHRASAPGEAPASVTGRLLRSIRVIIDRKSLVVKIRAAARHALWLEYGTVKMAPRPFIRPALRNSKKKLSALFARETKKTLNGRS